MIATMALAFGLTYVARISFPVSLPRVRMCWQILTLHSSATLVDIVDSQQTREHSWLHLQCPGWLLQYKCGVPSTVVDPFVIDSLVDRALLVHPFMSAF